MAVFPYYLQYAKGDMKLHVIGNVVFLFLLAPSLVWATVNYGAVGAGWAWLVSNVTYLLGWTPLVHRRFERGLHRKWLVEDLAPLTLVAGVTGWGLSIVVRPSGSRISVILLVLLLGSTTLVLTAIASRTCRGYAAAFMRRPLAPSPERLQ